MSTQPQPAPVLAWHREAHQAVLDAHQYGDGRYDAAAIIAAHDPHAETVRLLEEVNNRLNYTINCKLHDEVRTHLEKLKGTQ